MNACLALSSLVVRLLSLVLSLRLPLRRSWALGACALLLSMNVVACQPKPPVPVPVAVDRQAADSADAVHVKVGETFTIKLASNPTTGFRWLLDLTREAEDAAVVSKVSDDYVADAHAPGMVGVGGTERWTFRAEKPGSMVLPFVYRRAWEKGVAPAEQRMITVQVVGR